MTIILQHQFWDLAVSETGFEVGLSFGGIPEKLSVPFAAIKGFFDPSVQFGLQFEERDANPRSAPAPADAARQPPAAACRQPAAPAARRLPLGGRHAEARAESPSRPAREVVWLDRFRKK